MDTSLSFPFDQRDQHLCGQCLTLPLPKSLTHSLPPSSGATLVASRTGLDPLCSLCNLFATTIFPGINTQRPAPNSDTQWKLRSLNMHFASVPSQIRQLFPDIQVCILHAGDGERDYYKHINDEDMERRGYLAYARTRNLLEFMAQDRGGSGSGVPREFINLGEITVFTTASFAEQGHSALYMLFEKIKQTLNLAWVPRLGRCHGIENKSWKMRWDNRSDDFVLEPIMV